MSKLLSLLVAAVFAVSTGTAFAAAHAKAAPGEKKEEMKAGEMKKDEMKKDAKKVTKKVKKAKAGTKKEEMKK